MGRAIFISYRRDDTEGEAGRLFDDLTRSFGNDSVFMDVAGIRPGFDFRKAISDNVSGCGVLLAMVGPTWATIAHPDGTRRLDDPNDFVRLEIAAALERDIAVIPVLVHDAKMPRPDQLPDNLQEFAFRNSVELTHARWNSDVQLLIEALTPYIATSSPSAATVHATIPVQLPPANPPAPAAAPARRRVLPWALGSSVVLLLVLGIGYFSFRKPVPTPEPTPQPVVTDHSTPAKPPVVAPSPFAGRWTNPEPVTGNSLYTLAITAQGSQLSIHAFGNCTAPECDWGAQSAVVSDGRATATWQLGQGGRLAAITLAPANNALGVTVANTYANHKPVTKQFSFVRAR